MVKDKDNLVWIDCEFSSLDHGTNTILEIAVLVTDKDLNVLGEGVDLIIGHNKDTLETSEWVEEHFSKTLLPQVYASDVTMADAEQQVLDYISQYVEQGVSPLCGNTISSDRRILSKDMPRVFDYLHYRNIDVSTFKELAMRWKPQILDAVDKQETHRAMDDILESIEELKIYRKQFIQE